MIFNRILDLCLLSRNLLIYISKCITASIKRLTLLVNASAHGIFFRLKTPLFVKKKACKVTSWIHPKKSCTVRRTLKIIGKWTKTKCIHMKLIWKSGCQTNTVNVTALSFSNFYLKMCWIGYLTFLHGLWCTRET